MLFITNMVQTKQGILYLVCSLESGRTKTVTMSQTTLIEKLKSDKAWASGLTNAKLSPDGNSIVGNPAALTRFKDRPMVIVSRIVNERGAVLGYRALSPEGKLLKLRLSDAIRYCQDREKGGLVPFQNAIFNSEGTKEAFIKAYKGRTFPEELVQTKVEGKSEKEVVPEVSEEDKAKQILDELLKTAELYTKEQKEQLILGAKQGLNIGYYADPQIDWRKMRIIRIAMARGLNVSDIVQRDFIVPCQEEVLLYLVVMLAENISVAEYADARYSLQQLSEIHVGIVEGVNVSQYARPDLRVSEMIKIREELSFKLWG